jgi:ankyrin repeat protein
MKETPDRDALAAAAQAGDVARVKELVAHGCPLDGFDELGKTPLHHAVEGEHENVVVFLIESGADVNAHDERVIGNTPLGEVAGRCSLAMARLLLDAGADPTIRGWMQLNALDRARNRQRGDGPQVYQLMLKAGKRGN